MRHIRILALATTTAAVLVAACATNPTPSASRGSLRTAVAPAAASRADAMGRAELWSAHCARCHTLRARTEYSPAQWAVIVNHMRVVADLPGQDYRALLEYLADRTPDVPRVPTKVAAGRNATTSQRSP